MIEDYWEEDGGHREFRSKFAVGFLERMSP
jgi:hypothetical protein